MKLPAKDTTPRASESFSPMLSLNLNSLLSVIVLGVVGWVGMKTSSNADALIELRTSQPFLNQQVGELKQQLATLVTRSELDSRITQLRNEMIDVQARLKTLEIESHITPPNPRTQENPNTKPK